MSHDFKTHMNETATTSRTKMLVKKIPETDQVSDTQQENSHCSKSISINIRKPCTPNRYSDRASSTAVEKKVDQRQLSPKELV